MTSTIAQTNEPRARKPLRLWPGVAAVVVQWLAWVVLPLVAPPAAMYGILAAVLAGLVIVVWWLLFSRARWYERIGFLVLMVAAVLATTLFIHPSIANAGMGKMFYIFAIPIFGQALVAWAAVSRRLSGGPRLAAIVPAILVAGAVCNVVRTGGVSGDGMPELHWRWTPTPEQRILAQDTDKPAALASPRTAEAPVEVPAVEVGERPAAAPSAPPAAKAPEKRRQAQATTGADWPGFRGPARDGVVHGMRIATDWTKSPPVELWRRPIGPGWSSFAVHGNLLYTQEQRGDDEVVSSYRLTTGEPVWRHTDSVRFWESNGGPGPRATPTLSNGRVYTFGATGILNALDAGDGAVVWSRNAAADTGVEMPGWGFTSSPLVVDDEVIVAASGRLAAYDAATGHPRWYGPTGGGGYSSPHSAMIDGVAQILLMRGSRTTSVAPADGALLWEHSWQPGVSIVQPALAANGDILIATGDAMGGLGIRRIAIAHGPGGWTAAERWTSAALKPYFNDFVVHKGYAFGFDGSILACIDLADGTRKWKGGRYGHGQLLLLPDQDLLLVLSEEGALSLVGATPDQFTELARLPAIEGKTWNHPVLAGDVLLVRNGEEMAAFRVSPESH